MMSKNLQMLAFAAAMSETFTENKKGDNSLKSSRLQYKEYSIVPKGCKEYFFRENGTFSNDQMAYTELVFKCIAINDKKAIQKFNKWKEKNEGTGALAD